MIGAGPVGMVAALHLARAGVPSLVLEQQPERDLRGSRSIVMQRDGLDSLERIGLGRAIADAGVTWEIGRTYFRGREILRTGFPETSNSVFPPFVNTPQPTVEVLIEAACKAEPLITVLRGKQVTSVSQTDTAVQVIVDGADSYTGSHCLAADGARSTVRRQLGLSFDGESFSDQFLIVDLTATLHFGRPERRFYFDPPWNPGRQVLLHPVPDDGWRIDWQVPPDYDQDADDLDARIRQIIGRTTSYRLNWASVYRFHQRRASRLRVGRILLAGDAAHLMSPFGARGLSSGIADAENAAWKIAADRAGQAGPGLLESYDQERGAAADENLRVTAATMRFLVPSTPEEHARRTDVLERSVLDPQACAEIDSGRLAEPYWYLDSPLTTPGPDDAVAAFPRESGQARPPLPGVVCPDAELPDGSRLRHRLGTGFTLLVDECQINRLSHINGCQILHAGLSWSPGAVAALIRPDGHLAAVFTDMTGLPVDLRKAMLRSTGW
ncbi:pentachlorophenol monooxygenase [Pseudonocardiaceae bacterium YIM PH 21723]|nr:pentachlorophenol monooxygenase [Pseudonocardiaceae bacterium YIM PH 21723]